MTGGPEQEPYDTRKSSVVCLNVEYIVLFIYLLGTSIGRRYRPAWVLETDRDGSRRDRGLPSFTE